MSLSSLVWKNSPSGFITSTRKNSNYLIGTVIYNKISNCYPAIAYKNGKVLNIGRFSTEQEAKSFIEDNIYKR